SGSDAAVSSQVAPAAPGASEGAEATPESAPAGETAAMEDEMSQPMDRASALTADDMLRAPEESSARTLAPPMQPPTPQPASPDAPQITNAAAAPQRAQVPGESQQLDFDAQDAEDPFAARGRTRRDGGVLSLSLDMQEPADGAVKQFQ